MTRECLAVLRRSHGPLQWRRRPAGTAPLESTRGPAGATPLEPWGGRPNGPSAAPWGAPLTWARHLQTDASYIGPVACCAGRQHFRESMLMPREGSAGRCVLHGDTKASVKCTAGVHGGVHSKGPASIRRRAEGSCLRSAQKTAPARGLRQLAAAFAAKLPKVSALVPGVTAAPAMQR